MCKKTVCLIDVPGGAQFALSLCSHGFVFVPQNPAAQKILEAENNTLEKGLKNGEQPRVFGLDFSKIASQVSQETELKGGSVQPMAEVQIHQRKVGGQ
jgi:hypothetical protein